MSATRGDAALEALIRRDRLILGCGLAGVAVVAGIYVLEGAGMGMSAAGMTRMVYGDHSAMPASMMAAPVWSARYVLLVFAMWWIMMIAMMLPSAAPVILLAATVNRRAAPLTPPFGRTHLFLAGYLSAWAVFSLLATASQWALSRAGWMSWMTMSLDRSAIGGALLIAAALWQLTPLKRRCLHHCRSPADLLVTGRGRPALVTGLRHGTYCVGCCWALMALLFVGGVMNLFWIAALALVVVGEKLLPEGSGFALLVAVACGATGAYMLLR